MNFRVLVVVAGSLTGLIGLASQAQDLQRAHAATPHASVAGHGLTDMVAPFFAVADETLPRRGFGRVDQLWGFLENSSDERPDAVRKLLQHEMIVKVLTSIDRLESVDEQFAEFWRLDADHGTPASWVNSARLSGDDSDPTWVIYSRMDQLVTAGLARLADDIRVVDRGEKRAVVQSARTAMLLISLAETRASVSPSYWITERLRALGWIFSESPGTKGLSDEELAGLYRAVGVAAWPLAEPVVLHAMRGQLVSKLSSLELENPDRRNDLEAVLFSWREGLNLADEISRLIGAERANKLNRLMKLEEDRYDLFKRFDEPLREHIATTIPSEVRAMHISFGRTALWLLLRESLRLQLSQAGIPVKVDEGAARLERLLRARTEAELGPMGSKLPQGEVAGKVWFPGRDKVDHGGVGNCRDWSMVDSQERRPTAADLVVQVPARGRKKP